MPPYLILSAYKSGSNGYKPIVRVPSQSGKTEKIYKIMTASQEGFSDRERAMREGFRFLQAGKYL